MRRGLNLALCGSLGLIGCGASQDAVGPEPEDETKQEPDGEDAGTDARKPAGGDAGARGTEDTSVPSDRVDAGRPAPNGGPDVGEDDACQEVTASHQVSAPDMLIVLDRSGSMIGFGEEFGVDRWSPTKTVVASITAQFQDLIAFGLSMFAAPDPSGIDVFSCATGQLDVPMMTGSSGSIVSAIEAATPLGGATPTGATLEVAAEVLGDRTAAADVAVAPAYVLLMTDGEPTCEEGPTETTPAAVDRTNAAIERLAANGVKTYVVGYGVSGAAATMNGFAQRGGTEHYYAVEDGAQLSEEFMRITADVITCAYELAELPRDRLKLEVKLDGAQLNLDPTDGNGWTLTGTTVKLVGAPCAQLKDGQPHQLNVRELCTFVPPI